MIYVMSDIHGNMRRFRSVMDQIRLQPEDTLYILGDVIDRHPYGVELLQEIMAMPNVKMLLGNHEYMMLNVVAPKGDFCPDYSPRERWYDNHGRATRRAFNKLPQEERWAIVQYLRDLPLNIDVEVNGVQYKLVHAAPIEWYSEQLYDSLEEFAVWERLPERIRDTDYVMIQGHTPTMFFQYGNPLSIWYGKNRIDLDCGSGFDDGFTRHRTFRPAGRLACLRLDDMKEFYSEEYTGRKDQTGGEDKPDLN